MKNLFLIPTIFLFSLINAFANECCKDAKIDAKVVGCKIFVCVSPADGSEFCEGETTFKIIIRDEQGDAIESVISTNTCFYWDNAIPGVTYTFGGKIAYPFECADTGNITIQDEVTIPENCEDCAIRCIKITLSEEQDYCDEPYLFAQVEKCKPQGNFGTGTNQFPFGTTIQWEGSDGSSSSSDLFQIFPNIEYCVTVTDPIGCVYTECVSYECDVICTAPADIICFTHGDPMDPTTAFYWTTVPGATSYNVTYIDNSDDSNCCNADGNIILTETVTQTHSNSELLENLDCLVIIITANCSDGSISEPTEPFCFDEETNCPFNSYAPGHEVESRSKKETEIKISPNPVVELLTISAGELKMKSNVSIYDMQGKLLLEDVLYPESELKISFSLFQSGNYIVLLRSPNGQLIKSEIISKM